MGAMKVKLIKRVCSTYGQFNESLCTIYVHNLTCYCECHGFDRHCLVKAHPRWETYLYFFNFNAFVYNIEEHNLLYLPLDYNQNLFCFEYLNIELIVIIIVINDLFQFGLQQIVHKIQSIKWLINAKEKIKNKNK